MELYEDFRRQLTFDQLTLEKIQLKKSLFAFASKLIKMTPVYLDYTPEESNQLVVPNNAVAKRYFAIFKFIEVFKV